MQHDEKIDLEKLAKDERAKRFGEALEGNQVDEAKDETTRFSPQFPASGGKGW